MPTAKTAARMMSASSAQKSRSSSCMLFLEPVIRCIGRPAGEGFERHLERLLLRRRQTLPLEARPGEVGISQRKEVGQFRQCAAYPFPLLLGEAVEIECRLLLIGETAAWNGRAIRRTCLYLRRLCCWWGRRRQRRLIATFGQSRHIVREPCAQALHRRAATSEQCSAVGSSTQ